MGNEARKFGEGLETVTAALPVMNALDLSVTLMVCEPAVKSVTVRALEAERAELHLEYFGSPDQLQRTLAQAGLQLDKDADQWRLQAR